MTGTSTGSPVLRDPVRRNTYVLLTAFVFLSVGIGAVGYHYYLHQKSGIEAGARDQLAAVAELKVRQVSAWRSERLGDARIIAATQMMPGVRQVLAGTADAYTRQQVLTWLETVRAASGYANAILLDAQGTVRLTVGRATGAHSHYADLMRQVLQQGNIIFADLHYDAGLQGPHLGLSIPLRSSQHAPPEGGLLLGIDPNDFLYPLIRNWPTPSRTAETLMVRREGETVVYLNELRHRKGTALQLRIPLSEKQLPAVKAALGGQGIVDGIDYRGVPVLAAVRKVPDSSWILLAKIDVEEIYGAVRTEALWLALAVSSLVLAAGACGGLVWHHMRSRYYQEKYELERQRRQAEESLRQSEERFRRLVENAPEGIFVQTGGCFRYLNPAALALLGGSSVEQLLGSPIRERFHPDAAALCGRLSTADPEVPLTEGKFLRLDGSVLDVEVTAVPFGHENQTGSLVFFQNITERKQAEEAQRRSQALLNAVIEGTPDAVYVKDKSGRYLLANSAVCRVAGLPLNGIIGHLDTALFSPETARSIMESDREMMAARKMVTVEEDLTLKGGETATYFTAKGPLLDDKGDAIGLFGIARDITERKRSEEERSRLQEQLQQAQKMESIGRLAGGVAHDFNNLLTVINGYATLLRTELPEDDPLHATALEISKAGERAAALTQQLLAFSRKQVVARKVLDLNAVIRDVSKMLHRLVGENIQIVTALAPALGPVLADSGQMHQVLLNLAVNARDAMPRGGRLTIQTEDIEIGDDYVAAHADTKPGSYVLLAVSDTGTGMDEETRRRAFEPFFTTKPQGEGTGLGLSTVYGIVKQNEGWIWLYSEPGKGTTFKIYLPRVPAAAGAAEAVRPASSLPAGSETILVVEDQLDVREVVAEVLKRCGYEVLEADSGEEALKLCGRFTAPIDLLVTDVVMPGMTGPELADRLSPLRPSMKVLYTSGYPANPISVQGEPGRDVAFLSKPFAAEALVESVRRLLDER